MIKISKACGSSAVKKFIPVFLVILIIVPFFVTLIRPGFFSMFDDMQVIRVFEMNKCFVDFQIPCRWVPDLGFGYGYPLFSYYSPFPYYVMEFFHLFKISFIDSVKIGFGLSVLSSGIFFYLLTKKFLSVPAALFSTIIYVYAPFRASELYVRGAMGELWGMFAFPFVLWGFENLLTKKNKLSEFIFVISIAIYLTTHNLTVLMSLPVVVGWMAIRIFSKKLDKRDIFLISFCALLGITIAAFFWLPIIFEAKLVHLETLTEGYFNYLAHFLSLKQIFVSTHWGYGPSVVGSSDDVFLGLGPVAAIGAFLGIFGIIREKKVRILGVFLMLTFVICVFLSHSKSTFIWMLFPFLQILQFPWRFMVVGVFAASILGGIFVGSFKKNVGWLFVLLVGVLTVFLYGNFYQPKDWFTISDRQKLSGDSHTRQITASIYDYLPKSAKVAPDNPAPDGPLTLSGSVTTLNYEKGSDWFKVVVRADEDSLVSIPVYDFPVWEVQINNKIVPHFPFGKLGLVSFNITAGVSNISVRLKDSPIRAAADVISLVGVFVLFGFLYYEKIKIKFFKK